MIILFHITFQIYWFFVAMIIPFHITFQIYWFFVAPRRLCQRQDASASTKGASASVKTPLPTPRRLLCSMASTWLH